MAIFTIPSDFKIETVESIIKQNNSLENKVLEFYGSIRTSKIGSGRRFVQLPDADIEQLKDYVKYCT